MTNIRLIGYTALAVGLINWRYIDFGAGSFAILVGAIILLLSLVKPLHGRLARGPLFILLALVAALAVIYSFLS